MYKTLVWSHVEYCDFHILSLNSPSTPGITFNSLIEKVEKTQYQAALAITGTWQGAGRVSDHHWSRRIFSDP